MIAGAAGLGYVVAAAVENMEVLDTPLLGATRAEIRAAHADLALGIITSTAGALSLVLYLIFAVALGTRRTWAAAVGAALAFAGVVAGAALVAGADASWLFELQLRTRYAAGPFMALFLMAAATAVSPLRRPAGAVAVALTLAVVAETGDHTRQVLAGIAFAAHALWIWLASLWLLYGGLPWRDFLRRGAFLMLVVAAGAVGIALLAVPSATGAFFAWNLKPAGLAAFAGGIYVASAIVYAVGVRASWRAARPLVYAAVVLSVSVLTVTLIHLEVFDLHRLQAWAWLVLFAGFAAVTTLLAVRGPLDDGVAADPLAGWARAVFALAAVALAVPGIALWADPAAFALPPLGGRFAGSWTVMLAFLAAWAAVRNRRDEARLPALALVALPAGALVASARAALWTTPWYAVGLALLCAAGLVLLYRGTGWRGSYSPSEPKPGTSMLASTPQP